jgi:class 3 adenylate cyclase
MASTATITVLFCDLVGSTELYVRLGDAATDEPRRAFFAALRTVVAATGGEEVKNTGDGLMVVFPSSAADAVRCAIAMQRATEAVKVPAGEGLELRVGISVGEATRDDNDWFGTPVNEAARLCAATAPRTILASEVVRSLVESRGEHRFLPARRYRLKGLDREVVAAVVDWEADGQVGPPPVRPSRRSPPARPSRRGMAWLLVGLLVVVAVVASVIWSRSGESGRTSSSATISEPKGYTPELVDKACPSEVTAADGTVSCAELVVPENRAHPRGRQVHVEVVKLPARTDHPAAEPTVALADSGGALPYVGDALRSRGPIVVLVRRGYGGDPSLTCPELGQAYLAGFALPLQSRERHDQLLQASEQCGARWAADGVDLGSYTVRDAAADFRDLVLTLHVRSVNVKAMRDSAALAVRVVSESPGVVRAVLIGSPIEPNSNRFAGLIPDTARAFDGLTRLCKEDPQCAARFGDFREQMAAYVGERNANPVIVSVANPGGGAPLTVRLDGDAILQAAYQAFSAGTSNLPFLPSVAATRADQAVASFVAANAQSIAGFPLLASSVQLCLDGNVAASEASINADMATTPDLAGLAADALATVDGCKRSGWRGPRVDALVAGPVHALVVAGGLDPYGSSRRAESVARAFGPRGTVVVFPTLAGLVLQRPPDPCIAELEVTFLDHPTRPLDPKRCLRHIAPIRFAGT